MESGGIIDELESMHVEDMFQVLLDPQQRAIAKDVAVTLYLPKGFHWKHSESTAEQSNVLVKDLGTVSKQTAFTFEFFAEHNAEL